MITATRYHDISCGHRVAGHESKCAYLHGHNYRIHFIVGAARLDRVGRVLDFSVIKTRLCEWLEENWDHRFLVWINDPLADALQALDPTVRLVTFNPTAENMARHLLHIVGPAQLEGTGCELQRVVVDETRKCSAAAELDFITTTTRDV